jgi:integrase
LGEVVWIARYTNSEGRRVVAKPAWNSYRGTFRLRRDAQRAIDEAYGLPDQIDTLGAYFKRWPLLHPRAPRTQKTNEHRVTRALPVEIDGRPLRDWPFNELRRRHVYALIDALLTKQGRSALGATHVVRALSVMTEDAITDDVAELNPFKGVSVRANDPRVRKRPRRIRAYSWSEMHAFARAATLHPRSRKPDPSRQQYEPMIRCFCDAGMRLGEVLPLHRDNLDGELFFVRRTAHEGEVQEGT